MSSVHWPILRSCIASPLTPLIVDDRRTWRGIDLLVGAANLAGEIDRRCRSRTVGVLLPTGGGFAMTALAIWMTGRVVVPLNYLLKPEELQYVVGDCETDLVLTAGPMLEHLGFRPQVATLLEIDSLSLGGFPEPRWPASAKSEDLATLLYTSGTSGRPKGVMLSHGNITSNIRQCVEFAGFRKSDVVFGVLPQFHSFGFTVLTLLPLTLGGRAVYTARFVPQKIIRAFREHRPTAFVAIPSMYNALLSVKDATAEDFASLRFIVSGGEPLPQAVQTAFLERFGVQIQEGYGLTETSPVTNWSLPSEHAPGTVGRPVPGLVQRIVNWETGRAAADGCDGEVRMKGPNIMQGYFKLPKETAEAFDDEGWFRTGDIGRFDHVGRLAITGRLKEMIIVGGENVFPREIEEVLNKHPSVKASGVIGVRDDVRGELPWAWVELNEGATFDESALRAWCRERLAGYKVPREIRVIDALPRNPTGKILRRDLRALAT